MRNIYICAVLVLFASFSLSAQTVQGTIKQSTEANNCVDIFMRPDAAVNSNPGNYVFSLSVPDQTASGTNPTPVVSNLLQGTVLDNNNPPPYISEGRYFMDFNVVFNADVDVTWSANEEVLAGTVCFAEGTANVAELTQMNDLGTFGNNSFTTWYVEFDGLGDITNYAAKFYDDGGTTSTAIIGVDSQVETTSPIFLPIALHKFTATKGDNSVVLDWTTTSEINASHFDVERSQDLDNWIKVGTVQAAGESTELVDYNLVDRDLPLNLRDAEKTFYYRLMMVDSDGTSEYSDVRVARFDQVGTTFIAYPNPAYNEVFVNLSSISVETGAAQMSVIDKSGRLVKQVTLSTNDDISVDVSDIAPGAYFFVVRQGEKTFSQKIIKID